MEKHVLYLEVVSHSNGKNQVGGRYHIINLTNKDAKDRVIDAILSGEAWDSTDVLSKSDVLEYEGE